MIDWIIFLVLVAICIVVCAVVWLPLILGERRARRRLGPERYAEAKRQEQERKHRG